MKTSSRWAQRQEPRVVVLEQDGLSFVRTAVGEVGGANEDIKQVGSTSSASARVSSSCPYTVCRAGGRCWHARQPGFGSLLAQLLASMFHHSRGGGGAPWLGTDLAI